MVAKTLNLKKNIKRAEQSAVSKAKEDTVQVEAQRPRVVSAEQPQHSLTISGRLTREGFTAKSLYMNDALLAAAEKVIVGPVGAVINFALAYTLNDFLNKRMTTGKPDDRNVELPDATRDETIETKGFMGIKDVDFLNAIRWAEEELARAELAKAQAKANAKGVATA